MNHVNRNLRSIFGSTTHRYKILVILCKLLQFLKIETKESNDEFHGTFHESTLFIKINNESLMIVRLSTN